ncbi:type II toxin-antitoxin system VapC family toxin [Reichenbachiella ulvae]|uniref:Type II toxin-antitoxin system VapC family toxin n=1 Tax=Reichenbachiella ulvae TaxID=2980104 RepID=A0ABT3CVD6_9BACT|nr:type II toxin-antitoxin system VapC family toxin [Reichenbachiella ulvae]MCV9387562.1 type II toxin-antitoxin system VapC family toxin [Reichenbachiella ulvae]
MVVDTGVFIEFLRASNKLKTSLINLPDNSEIYISSISLYELYMGAISPEKWRDIQTLTEDIPVLSFTKIVSEKAGSIYHELRKQNQLIEFRDIFIAATALVHDMPVLHEIKSTSLEFEILNW